MSSSSGWVTSGPWSNESCATTMRSESSLSSHLTPLRTRIVHTLKVELMPIELKDFLMSRAQPVTEDLEIYACYRGVKEDLAKLKEEGWLREFNKDKFKELSERLQKGMVEKAVTNDEEEKKDGKSTKKVIYPVLYPVDKTNEYIEPRAHLPEKSLNFIRSIWHDERAIEPIGDFKWQKILTDNRQLSDF